MQEPVRSNTRPETSRPNRMTLTTALPIVAAAGALVVRIHRC